MAAKARVLTVERGPARIEKDLTLAEEGHQESGIIQGIAISKAEIEEPTEKEIEAGTPAE